MNKRNKQIHLQKKNAEKEKQKNVSLLNEIGISLDDELSCIGIVLQTFGQDEITLSILNNIAIISRKYVGLDIVLFPHHVAKTPMPILGSVFHINDLTGWEHPAIATDLTTCFDLVGYNLDHFYYYIFSLESMTDDEKNIFNSNKISFMFNKREDMELIQKEFDIKEKSYLIPNFNLQIICKIIAEDKNDKKSN